MPLNFLIRRTYILVLLAAAIWVNLNLLSAQRMGEYLGDETVLYAETKQVNQFFRRFNGEESADGKRFYKGDKQYRDPELRKKYLTMLFDLSNKELSETTKQQFIHSVTQSRKAVHLDFHGGNWFAEVRTTFQYQSREQTVTLFLELEEAKVGSKWVFTNIYFQPFSQLFVPSKSNPSGQGPEFIHPLSHELDFMNLIKVFRNGGNLEKYALNGYQPDYLTLFLYEIKRGNLRFTTVNSVKFHFFQIDNWYFELQDFQREGLNRGWLISQMIEIPQGQKEILMKYIYHQ